MYVGSSKINALAGNFCPSLFQQKASEQKLSKMFFQKEVVKWQKDGRYRTESFRKYVSENWDGSWLIALHANFHRSLWGWLGYYHQDFLSVANELVYADT